MDKRYNSGDGFLVVCMLLAFFFVALCGLIVINGPKPVPVKETHLPVLKSVKVSCELGSDKVVYYLTAVMWKDMSGLNQINRSSVLTIHDPNNKCTFK